MEVDVGWLSRTCLKKLRTVTAQVWSQNSDVLARTAARVLQGTCSNTVRYTEPKENDWWIWKDLEGDSHAYLKVRSRDKSVDPEDKQ
jgi:hypothetical protein